LNSAVLTALLNNKYTAQLLNMVLYRKEKEEMENKIKRDRSGGR
jgi:hypothetical protein